MTRDEFEATLKQARKFGGYGLDPFFDSLLAHDAEQQWVIEKLNSIISKWEDTYAGQKELLEQLRKELALLKADDAERCTLIRDMEEEERRKDQEIEEARRTAEYWKAEHLAGNTKIEQQAKRLQELEEWQKIVTGTGTDQEAVVRMAATEYTKVAVQCWKEKCEQQAQQIATLREALQLLYDVQNGCPLPTYQKDWDRAMELTQQALKKVNP